MMSVHMHHITEARARRFGSFVALSLTDRVGNEVHMHMHVPIHVAEAVARAFNDALAAPAPAQEAAE